MEVAIHWYFFYKNDSMFICDEMITSSLFQGVRHVNPKGAVDGL